MNDTENLVPQLSSNPQKSIHRRNPLSQKLAKSSQKPRRALGDITNSARQPLQPRQKHKLTSTPTAKRLQIWQNDDQVPEPEIIPPPPPPRPYQPAPLFSPRELADMRRELDQENDDSTDDFGRPFMTSDPIPIPPPPYQHESEDVDDIAHRQHDLPNNYFSPDQMFPKDELPTLEL